MWRKEGVNIVASGQPFVCSTSRRDFEMQDFEAIKKLLPYWYGWVKTLEPWPEVDVGFGWSAGE